jgi:gliding motility-associated-like protein
MDRLRKGLIKIAGYLIVTTISFGAMAQKPEVITVDKVVASTGEVFALKGSSFGTNAAQLSVYFGAAKGSIQSVTNQLLEVSAPPGATYNNISVSNTTLGLTGYSKEQFLLSYGGAHPFNMANLNSQVDFVTGIDLYDACIGDFDNDGKPDYATANKGENSISIMRNTSAAVGTISFTEIPFAVGFPTLHVRAGDLNGDGKLDLVLTQGGSSTVRDNIFILQNTSTGAGIFTFTMQTIKLTGRKNSKAEIVDMDLDGKPEVVVTDEGSNVVAILVNTSSLAAISFAASPVNVAITGAVSTDGLAVEDLNGDQLPEIVTSQYQTSSSNVFIVENNSVVGALGFGAITKLNIGSTVKRVKIGDLDGDQKPDITVTQLLGSSVSVFPNTGTGSTISFGAAKLFVTEANPWGLDFGDLDGDGKTDIVVASITVNKLTILNNISTPGNINFTRLTVNTTFAGRHVRVGDVDGDGKPDISFTGIDTSNPARIGVLRNRSCVVPVIRPSESPLALCTGVLPYRLTATVSRGSYYQWLKDGVALSCGLNQNTFDITSGTGSGTYTVKIFAEGANCSTNVGCAQESTGVQVTITAGTAADSNPTNNGPVCLGSPLNLSIANPIGGATYRWTGPNGFSATGTTHTISNFQLVNAGTYYVDVTIGSCVAKRESTLVEAIDVPTFTIGMTGSPVMCQGDPSRTLSVVPALGTFTYQWLKNGSPVGTGPTYTVTSVAASSGSYVVRASYAGCSTVETAPVNIAVATVPVAAFTAPATACAGQQITFTNQSTVDNVVTPIYTWNFGDGNTSPEASPNHIFATDGTYSVTLTVNYEGGVCANSVIKNVSVTPAPPVAITNPTNDFVICPGEQLLLEVLGTFTSYEWSTGATTPSITVTTGGTYSVEVTATNGCILTAIKVVTALPAPGVLVTAVPEQINEGETSQLQADGLDNYLWEPADGLSNPAIANPIATPLSTTTYTVSGTDASGCVGTGSIQVRVIGEAIVKKLIPGNLVSPDIVDAKNDFWVVGEIENYPQCGVVIYDDKGVKVFDAKPYHNDWGGTYNGKRLPDGVYFYIIRCDGEEGTPRTGSITLLR